MLNRPYSSLPEKSVSKERFEVPKLESRVQGKKTVISNFSSAVKGVQRDERQLYKFIAKETATAMSIEEGKLIMNGKFYPEMIDKMFSSYLKEYVFCHECKKPDTNIVENHGVKMLKCTACGALSALKKI